MFSQRPVANYQPKRPRSIQHEVAAPHAVVFVKDSAITTKIKTKLAADHITSLERIHVDTDKDGVVWLSGTATGNRFLHAFSIFTAAFRHVRHETTAVSWDC